MKSSRIASSLVAAALGLSASSYAQSQDTQASHSDKRFVEEAAQANLSEIEMGKLGTQKAENDQLKKLSESMQTDHKSANEKLQPIAQSQGVQFPQSLDHKRQREINHLEKLSGVEFDQEFATMALRDHAKAVELFQKEAEKGQDTATKQYAQDMLPTLQKHLGMAKDAAKSVGVKESTISSILKGTPEAVGGASSPGGEDTGAKSKN